MTRESLLAPWQALPEAERRSITAALQALADAAAEAAKWAGANPLEKAPVVDVTAARREGDALEVRYFYDFRLTRWPQSGSGWDDHYFHQGKAICRGGAVLSNSVESDVKSIPEFDCAAYDQDEAARTRRAAAADVSWQEWMSLPFPFPE